uniref:Uncharacterized protein n=1 Tax=Mastacembelus armatus TaxID=205130 RepID=A0A3Q3SMV6_9TELE
MRALELHFCFVLLQKIVVLNVFIFIDFTFFLQFSPYGFPVIRDAAFPPTPENPAPNSPVLPAETPSGTAPSRDTLQTMQQPQVPLLWNLVMMMIYCTETFLSLFQMASKMNQLGVYMSTVLTNLPAGAGLPVNQAAGLSNPEQEGNVPNIGTPSAGVSQQGLTGCGPQPNANSVPVGLEKAAQNVATVQTPLCTEITSLQQLRGVNMY